ncbi:MAG: hypothetical protein ABJC24_02770 [Chloroflexota bacterium]
MSRVMSALALAALLMLAAASTVAGARPPKEALSGFGSFVMPADVACGDFDVLYEETAFKEIATTWTKRDGSTVIHVTGRYQIRLTNMDTGAWIRASIAGPTFIHVSADGTTTVKGTGNWGFWFPGEHPFSTSGHMDPSLGSMEAVVGSLRGHWSDVCDHLA